MKAVYKKSKHLAVFAEYKQLCLYWKYYKYYTLEKQMTFHKTAACIDGKRSGTKTFSKPNVQLFLIFWVVILLFLPYFDHFFAALP